MIVKVAHKVPAFRIGFGFGFGKVLGGIAAIALVVGVVGYVGKRKKNKVKDKVVNFVDKVTKDDYIKEDE